MSRARNNFNRFRGGRKLFLRLATCLIWFVWRCDDVNDAGMGVFGGVLAYSYYAQCVHSVWGCEPSAEARAATVCMCVSVRTPRPPPAARRGEWLMGDRTRVSLVVLSRTLSLDRRPSYRVSYQGTVATEQGHRPRAPFVRVCAIAAAPSGSACSRANDLELERADPLLETLRGLRVARGRPAIQRDNLVALKELASG